MYKKISDTLKIKEDTKIHMVKAGQERKERQKQKGSVRTKEK